MERALAWRVLLATLFYSLVAFSSSTPDCPADIVLILDGSSSISSSSWSQLVSACTTLVSELGVSSAGAHVGVVQFSSSSSTKLELPLTGDEPTALAKIKALIQAGGSTDTAAGLELTETELAKRGRSDVVRVAILITDGESNAGSNPVAVADRMKQNQTSLFGIGVGSGADIKQIAQIASAPSSEFVFEVKDFFDLANIIASLVSKTCVGVTSVNPNHGPAAGLSLIFFLVSCLSFMLCCKRWNGGGGRWLWLLPLKQRCVSFRQPDHRHSHVRQLLRGCVPKPSRHRGGSS